jgi:hypothetical protein
MLVFFCLHMEQPTYPSTNIGLGLTSLPEHGDIIAEEKSL